MAKRCTRTAAEQDVVSRWRHVLSWRRGEVRQVKRGMNRRERHEARRSVRREED